MDENVSPPAFNYFTVTGAECLATATRASSSSTSIPEEQQNTTTLSRFDIQPTGEGMLAVSKLQCNVVRRKNYSYELYINNN